VAETIDLTGRVALVTGGGRGIGKAIAARLAGAGASVVIASRKKENLEAASAELAGLPGKVVPFVCHVGKLEQIENLVKETTSRLGPVDILVNNSATNVGQGPALDVTDEMLDKIVEINIKAALRLVRLTVPGMIDRGRGGSILNISSISGLRPQPGGLLYSFTKAGLIMLTRCWAREFGRHGIRVNALAPGLIQTDFSAYFWEDERRRREYLSEQPIGRLGQPHDVGGVALYLCSDDASFVTGQVFVIDGGLTA
jgi:NAD(P)-dependent dehydrogenase (short-subunit alcohol dehydrogenase family)